VRTEKEVLVPAYGAENLAKLSGIPANLSAPGAVQRATAALAKAPADVSARLLRQIGGKSAESIVDFIINKQRDVAIPQPVKLPPSMELASPPSRMFAHPIDPLTAASELSALRREYRELEAHCARLHMTLNERTAELENRAAAAEQTARRLLQQLERRRRGEEEDEVLGFGNGHHYPHSIDGSSSPRQGGRKVTQMTKELEQARETIAKLSREKAELAEENKTLREKLKEAEQTSIRTNISHAMVELALESAQRKNVGLQHKLGEANYQLKDQEIQLEASKRDTTRLAQALETISELRARTKTLEERIAALQRENDALMTTARGQDKVRDTEAFINNVAQAASSLVALRRSMSFANQQGAPPLAPQGNAALNTTAGGSHAHTASSESGDSHHPGESRRQAPTIAAGSTIASNRGTITPRGSRV